MTKCSFAPKQKAALAHACPAPAGPACPGLCQDGGPRLPGSDSFSWCQRSPGYTVLFYLHGQIKIAEQRASAKTVPAVRSGHSETLGDGATAGLAPPPLGVQLSPNISAQKAEKSAV